MPLYIVKLQSPTCVLDYCAKIAEGRLRSPGCMKRLQEEFFIREALGQFDRFVGEPQLRLGIAAYMIVEPQPPEHGKALRRLFYPITQITV